MEGQRDNEDLPLDLKLRVEELARDLSCVAGEWTLEFQLRDGHLATTRRHHGPIRNEELGRLTRTFTQDG